MAKHFLGIACCTLLAAFTPSIFSGCASSKDSDAQYRPPSRNDRSSIPWNRPQSWEGSSIPGLPGTFGTR